MNRPKVGIGMLVMRNGKVLLGKRKGAHGSGEYAGLGGHLEFNESIEDCARREALEEAGIEIKNIELLCISNIKKYGKHYLDIGLKVEWAKNEPKIMEKERNEGWDWYDLDNLPSPLFACEPNYFEALKTGKNFFDE